MRDRIDPGHLSDFVIYADESGDHGLKNIDPAYPLFVLAFIIMRREDYITKITPDLQRLKFDYWGHDQIVLHERDMRKKVGPFAILANAGTQQDFMNDLTRMIQAAPFQTCVTIIDKKRLVQKYNNPWNPYHLSLQVCMERLKGLFAREGQREKLAHIVFESRGKNEDNELELEFRRISDNKGKLGSKVSDFSRFRFEPVFAKKDANAAGLQIADLVARPYGMSFLHPNQANRTNEVLTAKIVNNYNGLTVLPEPS